MNKAIRNLKYKGSIGFNLAKLLSLIYKVNKGYLLEDRVYLSKRFMKSHDYPINWDNPMTLNEKLQVLKFQYNKELHQKVSDKFQARTFLKDNFSEEYLIPLVFETRNIEDIKIENFPDYPVIVKANHDAGNYEIIRDKRRVDWKKLRVDCKWWLSWNYYKVDRERQYKDIERRIVVEKLLITKDGKIPNDYKLNFINGQLEFVYVSVDREGGNYRNIYDANWKPLHFKWANKSKYSKTKRGPEIPPPLSWNKMMEIGQVISNQFPYVRVDFYDVDGKLYFGEVTLCHGGGFDKFEPNHFDTDFGKKLKI
jgi:hypothetical protein